MGLYMEKVYIIAIVSHDLHHAYFFGCTFYMNLVMTSTEVIKEII